MFMQNRVPNQRKKIQQYSYGLRDQIGKGFSSVVFKGKNQENGQIVAVKVIDLKGLKDQVGKKMLKSQIDILKSLQHKNILRCYDVYSTVNNCYIVTQYCGGGDVASILKKKRRLNQIQALKIFKDVYSGFKQMAERNIIHRDLKPANIFISQGIAKIADFGFAKIVQNSGEKEKYNVGTPLYMSPQSLQKNIYSIKNDIWSLGVILYQLINGVTPWQCRSQKQLLQKMCRLPVVFKVQVSDILKDFVKKCLQVNQQKRISLNDMQRHPFIIKLFENKQMDKQNISKPIQKQLLRKKINSTQNLNQPIRKQQMNQNAIKSTANLITSQINFCRFIFKLSQLCNQIQNAPKLQHLLIPKITKLKQLIQGCNQQNFMNLDNLMDFMKWQGFAKYRLVIQQYYNKYTKVFGKDIKSKNLLILQSQIKTFIQKSIPIINKQCISLQYNDTIPEQFQNHAISVDYMLTLYQLNDLVLKHWRDFKFFHKNSKIQIIADGKPRQLHFNHWQCICQKAQLLQLSYI